jgi:hypothetical protein
MERDIHTKLHGFFSAYAIISFALRARNKYFENICLMKKWRFLAPIENRQPNERIETTRLFF